MKTKQPKPHPDFVPSMLEHFDYMNPTRSREPRPSDRLRSQYAVRRFFLGLVTFVMASFLLVLGISALLGVM